MPSFDSLEAWLAWLETLHPSAIDLGLERVSKVADALGFADMMAARNATKAAREPCVITVAGTNGKGSFVAATECLLRDTGVTVGSYTSPHLLRYNERIRINGEPVDDATIVAAFEKVNAARGSTSLTYFEFGTLAALLIFREYKVAYWLLEVGMGGRLDAVNVIHPSIAVITSIALDHQAWLGDTREKIALEKAGIARKGIPVVVADHDPPQSLLKRLAALDTFYFGEAFNAHRSAVSTDFSWQGGKVSLSHCNLPLASVAAALQVCALLRVTFTQARLVILLESLALPGRFQKMFLPNGRPLILDVAHNPAATGLLAQKLAFEHTHGEINAIVAMMSDKAIAEVLQPMVPLVSHWYLLPLPDIPRAAAPQELQRCLKTLGVASNKITIINTLEDVPELVGQGAVQENTTIVTVFGSFYTVEQALRLLHQGT